MWRPTPSSEGQPQNREGLLSLPACAYHGKNRGYPQGTRSHLLPLNWGRTVTIAKLGIALKVLGRRGLGESSKTEVRLLVPGRGCCGSHGQRNLGS